MISQVFVVGRSFDVLDVFLFPFDASVGQFTSFNVILAVGCLSGASPMPHKSAHIFESRHFFVGQVGDDLEHTSTVAVHTVDVFIEQHVPQVIPLEESGVECKPSEHPFRFDCVVP